MARLTIQQTKAPDFSATGRILAQAGVSFERGLESAQGILGDYQKGRQTLADREANLLLAEVSSEDELDTLFKSGKLEALDLSSQMAGNLLSVRKGVVTNAGVRARTGLTGAQTDQVYSNIGINEAGERRKASEYEDLVNQRKISRSFAGAQIRAIAQNELLGTPKYIPRVTGSNITQGAVQDQVFAGLKARNMSDIVAEAFMMNFQDESGFDITIDEIEDGEGKGIYQLTGDRRKDFETKYNGDYSLENQLDWLMEELGGSESAAWKRIQQATTVGEAASLIASLFLRPSSANLQRRLAAYSQVGASIPITQNAGVNPAHAQIREALATSNLNRSTINQILGTLNAANKTGDAGIQAAEDRRVKDVGNQAIKDAIQRGESTTIGDVQRDLIDTQGLNAGQEIDLSLKGAGIAENLIPVLAPQTSGDPTAELAAAAEKARLLRAERRDPQTRAIKDSNDFDENPVASLIQATGIGRDDLGDWTEQELRTKIEQVAKDHVITRGEAVAAMRAIERKPPKGGILGRAYLGKADALDTRFDHDKIKEFVKNNFSTDARTRYDANRIRDIQVTGDNASALARIKTLQTQIAKSGLSPTDRTLKQAEIKKLTDSVLSGITNRQARVMLREYLDLIGDPGAPNNAQPGSKEYNDWLTQVGVDIQGHKTMGESQKKILMRAVEG